MTKICIFGAGAIGGLVAARLARAGTAEVSLVARGAHLQAIRDKGLTLRSAAGDFTVRPAASDRPQDLGPQDFIILGVKAMAIAGVIPQIAPLLGPHTAVLFAQNGLPWWYFHRHGGPHDGKQLESVDPGGLIWKGLGPERALGCIVWQAAEVEAPGIIRHNYGDRMPVGEPSGERSDRALALSRLLTEAGIKSPVQPNLRNEIWLKLWGNLSFNPVSVLTGGTLAELAGNPGTRRVIATMMEEARIIAEDLGIRFGITTEERMDMASKVGAHRTSMLQDVEAGRPTEIEALLGSVIELGRLTGRPTPALQLVYDLARFRDKHAAAPAGGI